jgi:hypothetical protein
MEELTVKVGDKVLVSGRYKEDDYIAKVEKVTPTGRIKLSGGNSAQFDKYGRQMGANLYFPYRLSIPTKEDYKRIEKNKLAGKIIYNIRSLNTDNLYNLDITTLTVIKAALDCIGVEDEKIKEGNLKQILDTLAAKNDNCKTKHKDIER